MGLPDAAPASPRCGLPKTASRLCCASRLRPEEDSACRRRPLLAEESREEPRVRLLPREPLVVAICNCSTAVAERRSSAAEAALARVPPEAAVGNEGARAPPVDARRSNEAGLRNGFCKRLLELLRWRACGALLSNKVPVAR